MSLPALYDGRQLDLIRRTVAKDATPAEFEQFIHICRAVRLDPLRRHIFCFIFNKDDDKKRQMTIVTSIAGYRAIADRTGSYRPGSTDVSVDPELINVATNPKGISHATATVYKFVQGEWHAVTERADWDEFAPLKEIWDNGQRTGQFALDGKKDGWRRMPRVMIEKCAEAKALRRAWPDDFAGLMVEDEVDRLRTIDATATELMEQARIDQRFLAIGGRNALTIDWCDGGELQRVPSGQFGDKALAFIKSTSEEPAAILHWANKNRAALQEYWALDKSGALAVKKALEPFQSLIGQAAE
jgi:phage recombination protein Bet